MASLVKKKRMAPNSRKVQSNQTGLTVVKLLLSGYCFVSTQPLENGHRPMDIICTHNKYHCPSWPINRKFITGNSGIAHNAVTSNTKSISDWRLH